MLNKPNMEDDDLEKLNDLFKMYVEHGIKYNEMSEDELMDICIARGLEWEVGPEAKTSMLLALKADAEYKRSVARSKEEELAQQELNRQRLNDPRRYSSSGLINARRTDARLNPLSNQEIKV